MYVYIYIHKKMYVYVYITTVLGKKMLIWTLLGSFRHENRDPLKAALGGDNSRIPHLLDIKAVKGCPQDHQCHNWLRGCFERNNGPSIASLIMIPT